MADAPAVPKLTICPVEILEKLQPLLHGLELRDIYKHGDTAPTLRKHKGRFVS